VFIIFRSYYHYSYYRKCSFFISIKDRFIFNFSYIYIYFPISLLISKAIDNVIIIFLFFIYRYYYLIDMMMVGSFVVKVVVVWFLVSFHDGFLVFRVIIIKNRWFYLFRREGFFSLRLLDRCFIIFGFGGRIVSVGVVCFLVRGILLLIGVQINVILMTSLKIYIF